MSSADSTTSPPPWPTGSRSGRPTKAKGFTVKLRIAEKEAPKTIKIVGGDGGVPMDFAFWLQLKEVAPYDTRMRLVLHIDLNMMMRMMIGSKIQGAIDQIAEALAKSFNAAPQV